MSLEKFYQKKTLLPSKLKHWRSSLRSEGKTLATLNGSFDLLHSGHLYILYEASKQADVLLVALNSDASIKQYKGEGRPIIPLKERLEMMCAITFVDYVTWFEESNPLKLLSILQPDVHVNGAEYGEHCIEAEVVKNGGGKLHLVERIPGLATSQIIDRIRMCCHEIQTGCF